MDTLLLKLILRLVKMFSGNNIDLEKLAIIAETKVMMDRRRKPVQWKQSQQKEQKNPLFGTLLMYAIFGIVVAFMIVGIHNLRVSMVILHSYVLFMMAMTLVTDFSSVLLDTTDNQIFLPRPVNSRTLLMARLVHVLVYLLQFMIALALAPLVATFITFGALVGFSAVLTILLTVAFAVFLTYLLYGLILRFANEQKVKDIIGYFQIFMTIFFVAGYQLVPRLIDFNKVNFTFNLNWYTWLLPPVWMAISLEAVKETNFDLLHTGMIVCALVVPVLTVWVMMKFLAPAFSRKLGVLSNEQVQSNQPVADKNLRLGWSQKLSKLVCTTKLEEAAFEQTWKLTGRDKAFKMRFYPSIAYIAIFAFIFVFKDARNLKAECYNLPNTNSYLWFIYIPVFTILSAVQLITIFDNFAASWVYQSAPIQKPGELINGATKAIILKFFLPVYLLIFACCLFIWGYPVADDFLFGLFNNLLVFFLVTMLNDHYLPFSRQVNVKQQTGKIVQAFLQLVLIGMLVLLHWFAIKIAWLPIALTPLSAIAFYLLMKRVQQIPWIKISL